jgi:lipopolysaccharide transport system ATP-binding protein
MNAVQNLCEWAILLENGHLTMSGETNEVVAAYVKSSTNELLEQRWDDLQTAPGNKNVRVVYAGITTTPGQDSHYLTLETPVDLVFRIVNSRPDKLLHFNVLLYNQENICIFNTGSRPQAFPKGIVQGICHIPAHLLNDSTYTVRLLIHFQGADGVDVNSILTFEVNETGREDWGWYGKWTGVIRPRLEWSLQSVDKLS